MHDKGTVVVVNGPRFSTRAESNFFSSLGEVINMTQYPEVALCRELELCYVNISLITDYDVGVKGEDIEPVSADGIIKVFNENNEKLRKLLFEMISRIPKKRGCECKSTLKYAKV